MLSNTFCQKEKKYTESQNPQDHFPELEQAFQETLQPFTDSHQQKKDRQHKKRNDTYLQTTATKQILHNINQLITDIKNEDTKRVCQRI